MAWECVCAGDVVSMSFSLVLNTFTGRYACIRNQRIGDIHRLGVGGRLTLLESSISIASYARWRVTISHRFTSGISFPIHCWRESAYLNRDFSKASMSRKPWGRLWARLTCEWPVNPGFMGTLKRFIESPDTTLFCRTLPLHDLIPNGFRDTAGSFSLRVADPFLSWLEVGA